MTLDAYTANGWTPADWIAAHLPEESGLNGIVMPTDEEVAQANARLEEHVVDDDLGYERGGDNDKIDADLLSEYASNLGRPDRRSQGQ